MRNKKIRSIVLSSIVGVSAMCFAVSATETLDLSNMDFSELSQLRLEIENEMNSRPEGEPFVLPEGYYIVGESISPGKYFVYMGEPVSGNGFWDDTECRVYESKDVYDDEDEDDENYSSEVSKLLGEYATPIILAEGNCLVVDHNPMSFSASAPKEDDYYQYIPPEGTLVPEGTYTVGNEIPAGIYTVYPATVYSGYYNVYQTQEAKDNYDLDNIDFYRLFVNKQGYGKRVTLVDGNIVDADVDCIMVAKQAVLDFD